MENMSFVDWIEENWELIVIPIMITAMFIVGIVIYLTIVAFVNSLVLGIVTVFSFLAITWVGLYAIYRKTR